MNIKTPVSWMGNKTSILHILHALFPLNYERYIEPFGGSGAVLLGKKKPDEYVEKLKKYKAVLSPDFSMYIEMNKALQL